MAGEIIQRETQDDTKMTHVYVVTTKWECLKVVERFTESPRMTGNNPLMENMSSPFPLHSFFFLSVVCSLHGHLLTLLSG